MTEKEILRDSLKKAYTALFIGPLLVFCTTAIAYQGNLSESIFLTAAISLAIIWLFPQEGLPFASAYVVFQASYIHFCIRPISFWELGLYISIFLSLFITEKSAKDFQRIFFDCLDKSEKEKTSLLKDWQDLSLDIKDELFKKSRDVIDTEDTHLTLSIDYENMGKRLQDKENRLLFLEEEKTKVKTKHQELENVIVSLEEKLRRKETILHEKKTLEKELEEKVRTLENSLPKRTKEPKETLSMNFSLRKELQELQQKFSKQEGDFHLVALRCKELQKFEPMYFQLRKQFTEKTETLQDARAKLFAAEETIVYLKKKEEEKENLFSNEEKKLFNDCAVLSEELECLREEQKELLLLIAHLQKPSAS